MATPTTLPAAFVAGQVLTAAQQNALRGAFRVLQVVSTTLTSTFTTTSTSFTDVTGLSVSITPSSTTSKVMVIVAMNGSQDQGVNDAGIRLMRDSTAIAIGDAGPNNRASAMFNAQFSNTSAPAAITFLDSPATIAATTYKIQIQNNTAGTSYVNRSKTDNSTSDRTASTITVMEISA
jgi:hypothetical protein